jgi:quercetin dioxygenase-like cupin family protein
MSNPSRLRSTLALAAALFAGATIAQAPTIKRTALQRVDIGNNMEVILGIAEIAPGGSTGRHSHFGVETGYILGGVGTLEIAGQPTRTLKEGESYLIPAGTVHDAKATGKEASKVLAVYVVEKGKPLATPAK